MDAKRLKEAYQRLESLDERLSYKIRSHSRSMMSPGVDQVDARVEELAKYTLELKEILREFMLSFARPKRPGE